MARRDRDVEVGPVFRRKPELVRLDLESLKKQSNAVQFPRIESAKEKHLDLYES